MSHTPRTIANFRKAESRALETFRRVREQGPSSMVVRNKTDARQVDPHRQPGRSDVSNGGDSSVVRGKR
ncbi:MAG: hypothetical protein V4550_19145 [Gemmatimonadota bacterium]